MIPADVDINDLARQLEEDSVAFSGEDSARLTPDLEPGLLGAVDHAESADFGALGIVILDESPPKAADLRDIAQELLLATDADTVIVRSPGSGAVVSDLHSRSAIESAQYPYFGDPDAVGGTYRFIDQIAGAGANWLLVGIVTVALVMLVAAATAWSVRQARRR